MLNSSSPNLSIAFWCSSNASEIYFKKIIPIAGDQNNSSWLFCSPEYSYRQSWGITKVCSYRFKIRKVLMRYDYPSDKEKMTAETVLKQTELIAKNWDEKS